ncbi:MAG TPA: shikimate kinase [Candidatus Limnocylindrales bacterium]|nr:shikimate kinase [Candidatus Limnocylindrales bacterium]
MSSRGPREYEARIKPLALLGFMGAGKTLIGALVAERARAQFFDLDTMVEDKAGMSIPEIFATHSEEAFRAFEKATLPTVLKPGAVVALGGGVVIDDDNWRLVEEKATSVYLEVPFQVIWERIHHLRGRPLIMNRTEAEVEELLERRRPRYEQATHRVDGTQPPRELADEVLKLWYD